MLSYEKFAQQKKAKVQLFSIPFKLKHLGKM